MLLSKPSGNCGLWHRLGGSAFFWEPDFGPLAAAGPRKSAPDRQGLCVGCAQGLACGGVYSGGEQGIGSGKEAQQTSPRLMIN